MGNEESETSRGKKILVVDDDVEMTMIIKDVLTEHDYEVEIAYNGLEAIKKSKEESLALILIDIRMPFFSGLWFCEAFKQRPQTRDIPVIVVSALSSEEDIQKAYERGACAYLRKPFRTEELLHLVKKVTSKKA